MSPESVANESLAPQLQPVVLAYQKEQQTLAAQYLALVKSGATTQQLQTWWQNNASQFQAQVQRANSMALITEAQTSPTNGNIQISSDLPAAVATYVSSQATLANAFASERKQMTQSLGGASGALTPTQLSQAECSTLQAFVQQNASAISQQGQRAAAMAIDVSQRAPAIPSSLTIPTGASVQVTSYLQTQNLLRQQLAQFQKQYATAQPSVRAAAYKQWVGQNAVLIQQFQTQGQNLAQTSLRN